MRLYVVYDESGSITALSTHPEGAPEPVMKLEPGEKSGFIDAPEIDADSPELERYSQLENLMARYRVEETPTTKIRLSLDSKETE